MGSDHQLPGIAADGVAGLGTPARSDQWVEEVVGLAPAFAVVLKTLVEARVENVPRRPRHVIQAPIRATQPALANETALYIEGAAGQIDHRALLGHHVIAGETYCATLGHPLTDAVPLRAEVTTDFQQTTGRVPTVSGIAVGAGRHEDQLAHIDPHVIAVECAAFAVDRGIALLVALHVDLDVVGFHRHFNAKGTRDIDQRAVAHQAALPRRHRDLATGGKRHRTVLKLDGAAAADVDARLVTANTVVERHPGQCRIVLTIQGSEVAAVEHDCADTPLAEGHAAAGVGRRVEQMNRATGIHRGTRQQHAVLRDFVTGHGDVAGRGLDQAGVADLARTTGLEARNDFAAKRGGKAIAFGARAFANVKAVTGAEHGLAFGGADGAGVLHFIAEQQRIATRVGGQRRLVGFNPRPALHQHFAGGIGKGRLAAGAVVVQAAIAELGIADVRRRRHQVAYIHLAGAAEHDAVAVDQHHRAVALDLALDLARPCAWVVNAVEHRPVRLLGELDGGIAPDVEGFPVENGLVGGLLDLHRGLAIGLGLLRPLGVLPTLGQAGIDFQATLAQAVWHELYGGECRCPPSGLRSLLRGDGRHGVVERLHRSLQLLPGSLLLRQRRCHARQAATRSRCRGLLRCALGGEPAGTERRCRLGTAGHQAQRNRLRQRLEQPQRRVHRTRSVTADRQGMGIATGLANEHHY
ncbi:hypothetical protein D3C87_1164690 [compost metagenome]